MNLTGPAAARLYDDHVDAIYSYVARRLGPDVAVDVVGDVFEHALRAQRKDSNGSERGWLLAIATALMRRHGDVERARLVAWGTGAGRSSTLAETSDPLLSSGSDDQRLAGTNALMSAVAELEPVDRDLLFLVTWEHCSKGVVAEAVGITPGSVRTRLSAIRKELKQRLAGGAPGEDVGE